MISADNNRRAVISADNIRRAVISDDNIRSAVISADNIRRAVISADNIRRAVILDFADLNEGKPKEKRRKKGKRNKKRTVWSRRPMTRVCACVRRARDLFSRCSVEKIKARNIFNEQQGSRRFQHTELGRKIIQIIDWIGSG